jgi:hypothetical protein
MVVRLPGGGNGAADLERDALFAAILDRMDVVAAVDIVDRP